MTDGILEDLLAHASDPIILIDGSGSLLWTNCAFSRLIPAARPGLPLTEFLSAADRKLLVSISHYGAVSVTLRSPECGELSQTAVAIDVGKGDLDDQQVLITFKSTQAESTALREKESWLSNVAHDLKNPLSAIFGYADTLLDTPTGASMSPAQREVLARIRGTASRATDLVRNYQHMSQIAARGVPQSRGTVDLNAAIQDVVNNTWREDTNHPRISLELAQEPLPVLIDRVNIERVISNLFTNAVKFAEPLSVVTIRSAGPSRSNGNADMAQLTIHNTGAAIRPEEKEKLFRPFSRVSTSQGKPGTGLGLAIVRQLVDGSGGSVSLESTPENGTTVTVRLPFAR